MKYLDRNTVVVALSGGLDSAASALQLLDQGYTVLGVHFRVNDDLTSVSLAERNASWLGIPITVLDLRSRFRSSVIDYFVGELAQGRTPSPCSYCNPHFKWLSLVEFADSVGAYHLAMGHYVRLEKHGDDVLIRQGVDPVKDQSYYLWDLSQEVLSRAIFPLGGQTKSSVREYLCSRGYSEISSTTESMSLCFLPKGVSYRDFVLDSLKPEPGEVVDQNGRVVGAHSGAMLYTIGQRRGFEVFDDYASVVWVVVGLDVEHNRVVVSDCAEDLYSSSFVLDKARLNTLAFSGEPLRVLVRGLGRNPSGGATITPLGEGAYRVDLLDDKAWAVAAGQPVVIYCKDLLLGGGYVKGRGKVELD